MKIIKNGSGVGGLYWICLSFWVILLRLDYPSDKSLLCLRHKNASNSRAVFYFEPSWPFCNSASASTILFTSSKVVSPETTSIMPD